jgi:hypothetical protein
MVWSGNVSTAHSSLAVPVGVGGVIEEEEQQHFSEMILTIYSNVKLFLSTPCRH